MHLRRAHPALVAAVLSVVGASAAAAVAAGMSDRVVSRGTVLVRRSTGSATTKAEDDLQGLARGAFDRDRLAGIVDRYDLYGGSRAQVSTDDRVVRMREDIGIQVLSPSVLQVSFAASDGRRAQQVARELMAELVRANFERKAPTVMQVIDSPDQAEAAASPRRVAQAGLGGSIGGALIGTLIWFQRRRVSRRAS
jgi:hypothetical protein